MSGWHSSDISEVSLEFGTDTKVGRINIDSKRKRNSNNNIFRVAAVDSASIVRKIASDASLVLLAVTYVIAALIGFHAEALVAIPILLAAFALSCYIRYSSEKRIHGAHSMLYPKAKIIENGKRFSLIASDVEIGDLISFSQGDIIPADARLVSSENLHVAERFYNKLNNKVEYKRLMKNHEAIYVDDNVAEIYDNMVYAGSAVVSGRGRAIVTAIGPSTRIGRSEKTIHLSPENDQPDFMHSFGKFTKRFSLAVLLSLIPISIILIYSRTLNTASGDQPSILYTFLLMLAVAVTSMSEPLTAPSSAIVSNTLFGKRGNIDSGITKLSSLEHLANTDTLLILCQDTLVDKREFVRRVFLSDKEYRFDSIRSEELCSFSSAVALYLSDKRNSADQHERRAINKFVTEISRKKGAEVVSLPSLIRVDDISAINDCDCFRTDGGSQWQFNDESRQRLIDFYYRYLDLGLKVYLFVSTSEENQRPVFEGMMAIGEEYPYSDGTLFSDCLNYGITPVWILESENDASLKLAFNCGIVNGPEDIVFSSQLEEKGLLLSDVPTNTRVYIGFGRDGTKEIVTHIAESGRKILPIIKNLSDKSAILPLTVYSTHKEASYESVKYTSALSLGFANAENRRGGIFDAVNNIKQASFVLLKLNAYKRYLTFATVYRLSLIMMSLLTHTEAKPMTALMILLSGLISDFSAIAAFSSAKGTSVTGQRSSQDPPTVFYAIAGICIALVSHIVTNVLLNTSFITNANSQSFCFYASLLTQFITLGAFLLIINNGIRKFELNFAYISALASFCILVVSQNWFTDTLYAKLTSLSFARVELKSIPVLLISGVVSFSLIFLISKFFAHSDKN